MQQKRPQHGTCAMLEAGIQCIDSINKDCFKNSILLGDLTLDHGRSEIYSNQSCFYQRFDEYFNQDGLCSFQDVKE